MELHVGRHFRLNRSSISDFFLAPLPPLLVDLLHIGMSVYVVDRLAKRKQRLHGRAWPRSIPAVIKVFNSDFWNQHPVHEALTLCLEFVSGDNWELRFVDDPTEQYFAEQRLPGVPPPFDNDPPLICLNSGGLDSATGLCLRLREGSRRPVIPVTVWHQAGQQELVRDQLQLIGHHYGVPICPLFVSADVYWSAFEAEEERSQRCRSFLFAAVGGVAAAVSGASGVDVFESGVGAINLPLMAGMVGSKATRSCHPEFLRMMSHLFTLVAGREITFRLPFMDKTKGQMVKMLADDGLENVARSTVSCVHYPLREKPHKQCGVCPACIFRRQSMFVGGINEPSGTYKFDLFGPQQVVNQIPDRVLKYLKAFLMQVVYLADLEPQSDLPRRFRRHLLGSGIIGHGQSPGPVIEVLRRYRQEWLNIAAEGIDRGWDWAKLLAPTKSTRQEGLCHASA
ncbi:MAG: 7-cyano-7-deazaguanine synthase [Planctomycetes bacterium]|nr:7-cyano-7-deazaguanine synthase [Planctomycetota bacterium]